MVEPGVVGVAVGVGVEVRPGAITFGAAAGLPVLGGLPLPGSLGKCLDISSDFSRCLSIRTRATDSKATTVAPITIGTINAVLLAGTVILTVYV